MCYDGRHSQVRAPGACCSNAWAPHSAPCSVEVRPGASLTEA